MSQVEQRLAAGFRARGVNQCHLDVGGDNKLSITLVEGAEPIKNPCHIDKNCCYQNDHGGKCDLSLHRNFDKVLHHVAQVMGV